MVIVQAEGQGKRSTFSVSIVQADGKLGAKLRDKEEHK